ncbi:MAG TPA: cytochrome c nitrite reductase small subunit [Polyangiaceae bacterium]|nr:cytochrome c nitrite reductase small subunit [Polyangiaceae bacterium]
MRQSNFEKSPSLRPGTGPYRTRRALVIALCCGIGAGLGIGGYTFRYANGLSYFSTDPAACANCHIMRSEFDAWQKSSHHAVATCIDCHLPHSLVPKYMAKAENGYRHSKAFTEGNFEEPIFVRPAGRTILQDNCVYCHQALTESIAMNSPHTGEQPCLHCHSTVGHGDAARLGGPLRKDEIVGVSSR